MTSSAIHTGDPRERRRAEKVGGILNEAWALARRDGLGALSLRDLAAAVGLRQPSLYVYFASKNDLYDALFADGYQQLLDYLEARDYSGEPRAALKRLVTDLVRFSSEDFVRHQLLFQRTIPGFEPSEASMALALQLYRRASDIAQHAGATSPDDIDVFSAIIAGLAHQQTANDPGGSRWVDHVPRLIDMYCDDLEKRPHSYPTANQKEPRRP